MATAVNAGGQNAIRLRVDSIAHPIKLETETGTLEEADWFVCTSCGYSSEQEARKNGERLRSAFILAGAINRLGVDFGFGGTTFQFGPEISAAYRESTGRELRGSIHGLDVFEKDKVTVPVASKPRFRSHRPTEALQQSIQDAMNLCANLSERQEICASLINDSFFVANQDVRFVMLISAVEALCEQRKPSDSYRSLIDLVLKRLSELEGSEAEKNRLSSILRERQKKVSVRQANMSKITTLIGRDKAKKFDDELYPLRSGYLHEGEGRGEVGKGAEEAFHLALELLEADIRAARLISGDPNPPPRSASSRPERAWGGAEMLSRLGMLVFIVLPVVVIALGVAVAAIFAIGWVIQHVIA